MKEVLADETGQLVPDTLFSRESAAQIMSEHALLYLKHCAEVGYFKEDKPEMMWNDYFALENNQMLRVFCVRNAGSELIGYALFCVRQNLHYAAVKVAHCDMIYILPEYRGGTGERFVQWIDKSLKDEGVNSVSHHAKTYFDFGSMLSRLEYKHVENIYIRRLN